MGTSRSSFQCGGEYHAPTDCDTIKRWLTKCADDSETANYISAHTKDVRDAATFFPLILAVLLVSPQAARLSMLLSELSSVAPELRTHKG